MPPNRILVCGGRDYANRRLVFETLDALTIAPGQMMPPGDLQIAHGGCPTGADRWASDWATITWVTERVFPADWRKYGKAAGPIRNHEMIRDFRPDLVVAFPGGTGTADCVRKARLAGVSVREVHDEAVAA